jgi:tRNA pseudouridine55 synthase
LDATIYRIIEERRQSGSDRGDLLSMLLMARDTDGDGSRMTDDQLRDEIVTIFIVGHETSALTLAWAWYLLARHPEFEARLHEEVDAVLPRFTGEIAQIPPTYSALKIGGKAAYSRARAGEIVEMKARTVTIHDLNILPGTGRGTSEAGGGADRSDPSVSPDGLPPPRSGEDLVEISLSAEVSKGTYIRSLARDIAHALGTVGHVSYLRRTRAGPFGLDTAVSLDFLTEIAKARQLTRAVLPLQAALDDIPALPVTPDQAQLLRHGQKLAGFPARPGLALATDEDRPVALVEASADGLRVVRGFNL